MVTIDLSELKAFFSPRTIKRARPTLETAFGRALISGLQDAKTKHDSWRNWTGNLERSILSENLGTSRNLLKGSVFIDPVKAPYGIFQYFGTRAHGAVNAKALRFVTRSGKVVFAKWVRGIKGDPWIEKALSDPNGGFFRAIDRGVDEFIEEIVK